VRGTSPPLPPPPPPPPNHPLTLPFSDAARYYRFHLLWSLKESYFKALGVGLSTSPLTVTFHFTAVPPEVSNVSSTTVTCGVPGWEFTFVHLQGSDVACVAREGGGEVVKREWEWDELI